MEKQIGERCHRSCKNHHSFEFSTWVLCDNCFLMKDLLNMVVVKEKCNSSFFPKYMDFCHVVWRTLFYVQDLYHTVFSIHQIVMSTSGLKKRVYTPYDLEHMTLLCSEPLLDFARPKERFCCRYHFEWRDSAEKQRWKQTNALGDYFRGSTYSTDIYLQGGDMSRLKISVAILKRKETEEHYYSSMIVSF